MADKNVGDLLRFTYGGKILVGASADNILEVEEGSVECTIGGRTGISRMDRGQIQGQVYPGSERPSTLNFNVRLTTVSLTTAGDLLELLEQTYTNGLIDTYPVVLQFPDAEGSSTGQQLTYPNCWLPEPLPIRTGGLEDFDMITFALQSQSAAPIRADY